MCHSDSRHARNNVVSGPNLPPWLPPPAHLSPFVRPGSFLHASISQSQGATGGGGDMLILGGEF